MIVAQVAIRSSLGHLLQEPKAINIVVGNARPNAHQHLRQSCIRIDHKPCHLAIAIVRHGHPVACCVITIAHGRGGTRPSNLNQAIPSIVGVAHQGVIRQRPIRHVTVQIVTHRLTIEHGQPIVCIVRHHPLRRSIIIMWQRCSKFPYRDAPLNVAIFLLIIREGLTCTLPHCINRITNLVNHEANIPTAAIPTNTARQMNHERASRNGGGFGSCRFRRRITHLSVTRVPQKTPTPRANPKTKPIEVPKTPVFSPP